ncbi:hypothetical protein CgunFtcFv8_021923 [Champsocephalus gunnari]|uniref:Uncharacterized protein n=1 Tax=Champsocephalus gunnari TaxID=52237 RepID=A0AAN8DNY0_CHAGU|nr:hypothetical protein CgunFtcFv8_021923 [Champsocephalus gunnari]
MTANRGGLQFLYAHLRRVSSNARCLRQPHSHIHSGSLPSPAGNTRVLRAASPRHTCSGTRVHGDGAPWRTPAIQHGGMWTNGDPNT